MPVGPHDERTYGLFPYGPRSRDGAGCQNSAEVAALVSALIYVLRVKRKTPWTIVAWFCFLSGLAPYSIGRLYLWNNTVAAESGSWLAFALMGQLYASLACAVCATLEFFPPQSPNSISEIDAPAPPAAIFESPS